MGLGRSRLPADQLPCRRAWGLDGRPQAGGDASGSRRWGTRVLYIQPRASPPVDDRLLLAPGCAPLTVFHVLAHPVWLTGRTHQRPAPCSRGGARHTRQPPCGRGGPTRSRADNCALHPHRGCSIAHRSFPPARVPATRPRAYQPGRAGYPSAPSPGPAAPRRDGHTQRGLNGKLRDQLHRLREPLNPGKPRPAVEGWRHTHNPAATPPTRNNTHTTHPRGQVSKDRVRSPAGSG